MIEASEASGAFVVSQKMIDLALDELEPLAEIETFSRRAGGAATKAAIDLAQLGDVYRFSNYYFGKRVR